MRCNYTHSWYFSHSISALSSGTGGYNCESGCKIQLCICPSTLLVSVCSLVLKIDSSSHSLQLQLSSLSAHVHSSFSSPSCITELLLGCWHMCLTHFSLWLSELPFSLPISCRCYSQLRVHTIHYKLTEIWKSTPFSTENFPMLIICCEHWKEHETKNVSLQNMKPLMKSLQNYVLEHNSYLIWVNFT